MKVVDPHMHLWDLESMRYPWLANPRPDWLLSPYDKLAKKHSLQDFLRDAGEVEVQKVIHIEAGVAPDSRIAESCWLQSIADDPSSAGRPNGIVAAIDLSASDIDRTLEEQMTFPAIRGVRQILNVHSDPLYDFAGFDFMHDPAWKNGFSRLSRFDLSFDLQIYPSQMVEAGKLAQQYPHTIMILNHTGMFVDRNTVTGWRAWRDGLKVLAINPNVMAKISGMGMLDHHWTIESIRPYVLETIDCFGIDRCMFASNFPVDGLFGSYSDLWRAYHACVSGFSETEKEQLFRNNAERIYRI